MPSKKTTIFLFYLALMFIDFLIFLSKTQIDIIGMKLPFIGTIISSFLSESYDQFLFPFLIYLVFIFGPLGIFYYDVTDQTEE